MKMLSYQQFKNLIWYLFHELEWRFRKYSNMNIIMARSLLKVAVYFGHSSRFMPIYFIVF